MSDLIRRPELKYDALAPFDPERPTLSKEIREQVEIRIKYEGYIKRQLRDVEQFRKLESRPLPADLDFIASSGGQTKAAAGASVEFWTGIAHFRCESGGYYRPDDRHRDDGKGEKE